MDDESSPPMSQALFQATAPALPVASTPHISAGNVGSDFDLSQEELLQILELAAEVKRHPAAYRGALKNRILSLLFEKPSLRTRITFEVAAKQLGGDSI